MKIRKLSIFACSEDDISSERASMLGGIDLDERSTVDNFIKMRYN